MKVVSWNFFLDHEKRERWLNEMAAKGLALTDYTHYRYVFQEGRPGEYQYRMEMLSRRASEPESVAYIRFLEETGAEHVASVGPWVYFRKKADLGEFSLFSDREARRKHYRRIARCYAWGVLRGLVGAVISFVAVRYYGDAFFWGMGLGACLLGLIFLAAFAVYFIKLRRLNKEMRVCE